MVGTAWLRMVLNFAGRGVSCTHVQCGMLCDNYVVCLSDEVFIPEVHWPLADQPSAWPVPLDWAGAVKGAANSPLTMAGPVARPGLTD